MPIEKGLIGCQDISFGTGTFQRKSQSGQLITLDQIRASHVPILDSAGRFTGTEVETALAEVMTREESGSSVKKLTNRSGAQRVAGDVVIIDTSNDDSFTTTTTEGNVLVLGVVLETVANLATGRVATGGYVGSVKVTGATVRGDYLKTSTTVLKAASSSTFAQGVFAVALSNSSSVVSAYIFGVYAAASGTVVTNLNADMVDGKHIDSILGTWDATKTVGSTYQAVSDLIVIAVATSGAGSTCRIYGETDSGAIPTTRVADNNIPGVGAIVGIACITFPVKKNHYYQTGGTGASYSMKVIPIGV